MPDLTFPLDEVLTLVEHAAAAPSTLAPVAGEPPGPALLLLAADEGICLLSNGLLRLDAAPGEPHAYGIRAVYADGHGPGTPTAGRDTAVTGAPITAIPIPTPVLRRLRATTGCDLFTVTLTARHVLLGVARRHPSGEPQAPTGG